jgi:hypothetical protein
LPPYSACGRMLHAPGRLPVREDMGLDCPWRRRVRSIELVDPFLRQKRLAELGVPVGIYRRKRPIKPSVCG